MCNVGDEVRYCPDCHRTTTVVLDHASGDTICTECALVQDERFVDETSEWRTFSDDGSGQDHDRSRVGSAGDPFLSHVQLGTTVTPVKRQAKAGADAEGAAFVLKVRNDVGPTTDKALIDAFQAISDMADRLGLVATIKDGAKELFKKMEAAKLCPRGRNRDAVYAACLHIACRIQGKPRTLKELASATRDGAAARKDIGKFAKLIKEHLGEEAGQAMATGVVHAADYMSRFGSLLGMGKPEVRAAQGAAQRLEEGLVDVRRNPESIAAAIIYMAMQRAGAKKSARDVSMATGVGEATIKEACKDLSPHAELLFA